MSALSSLIHRLIEPSLARRLLSTALWSVLGEFFSKGFMLLSLFLIARILGKEGYGYCVLVRTTTSMFATLVGMGLGVTANRYVSQYRDTDKRYSGRVVESSYILAAAFGFLAGMCLFLASGYLARSAFSAPQ